jgi:hypothetical protein
LSIAFVIFMTVREIIEAADYAPSLATNVDVRQHF